MIGTTTLYTMTDNNNNNNDDDDKPKPNSSMLDLSTEKTVRIKNTDALKEELHNAQQQQRMSLVPVIPAAAHPDDDYDDSEDRRIRLGICAMDKKARSKPMAEILRRLDATNFRVVFFGDDVILEQPVEDWPRCDALIAFFSKGFPLHKAKAYHALRRPFLLNDLELQEELQDRRRVYDKLGALGICVPRHVFVSRDAYVSTLSGDGNGGRDQLKEFDDHIEVNGITIHKPFVEKPVDAEGACVLCVCCCYYVVPLALLTHVVLLFSLRRSQYCHLLSHQYVP